MHSVTRRLLVGGLAWLVTLSAVLPVSADEPDAGPDLAAPGETSSPPTVHAEMLAEHAAMELALESGATPEPMPAAGGVLADGAAAGTTASGLRREVLGYLPYWTLTGPYVGNLRYDRVSTLAYFSVAVEDDGTLDTSSTSAGWTGWNSSTMTTIIGRAHTEGVRVVLTVTMMAWDYDYTAMSALLNDPAARGRLAHEIAAAVRSRNADGVNLDFEPMPNSLQSQYSAFVRDVKAALVSSGAGSYLTVATTGGAATWDEGYDLAALTAAGAADALMVMAYDFNWSGSARAGGVAPMDSPYTLDVRQAMNDYLRRVPASKLIWGVPYYGRAWTTTTADVNAPTCRSAGGCRAASWAPRYIDALEAVATHGRRWDGVGQVPWYTYWSQTYSAHVQGYYEDADSLDAKYRLVNANQLGGIGIWHLFMDGSRTELWGAISRRFAELPFSDIAGSGFIEEIIWLAETGITNGCGSGVFCPTTVVTRDQMASFLARALALPEATQDFFTDDAGSIHERDINRVAQAGITLGCAERTYCPGEPVAREQMASFLARALELPAGSSDLFDDDDGSLHEADINRLASAGVTNGCAIRSYCPADLVTREQMAAFLYRALRS